MPDPTSLDAPQSVEPGVVTPATPTLQVDPSKLKAVAITLGLAIMATLGGSTTLLHFAKDRDLAGIVGFFQSSAAVPFFTGLATIGGIAGLAYRTALRKAREIYLAWHTSDRIAIVTGQIAPPAPPSS